MYSSNSQVHEWTKSYDGTTQMKPCWQFFHVKDNDSNNNYLALFGINEIFGGCVTTKQKTAAIHMW